MSKTLEQSFKVLKGYCEKENFKGWDPYDGLNSKIFNVIPFAKRSAICRLVVIQGFKRFPFNLRPLALISKGHNPKGIALFLQGYCNLYRVVVAKPELSKDFGTQDEIMNQINYLSKLLIDLRSPGDYHGAGWGYNFDWQSRRQFLFPKFTPTIVCTNFCATALMDAYEVTKNQEYLDVALTSAEFILKDLNRSPQKDGGFIFSYSKFKGNDTVYNASLLGSRLLSYCYKYTGNESYKEAARQSVIACCHGQREDGAWNYGTKTFQNWVDSFHTGYDLDALIAYQELTGDQSFNDVIDKGFKYYIENFFDEDGSPKYYDNQKYPIDIHCPGQLFVTLSRLHKFGEYRDLAEKVLNWTVENMQDKKGYFYYQLKKGISSKISYMRWSNAFMFCALSYFILNKN